MLLRSFVFSASVLFAPPAWSQGDEAGAPTTVTAVERAEPEPVGFEPPAIELHGFASQGFIKSTGNNYLARSKRGSFELTEVGLNVTAMPQEKLRIGAQLFAYDLGPRGNFDAQFDWFYVDYRHVDWLGVRVGRIKVPFGLFNEFNDIDAGRVPILLPQSVYPVGNRNFLLAQSGGELYGYTPLGGAGGLEYRVYGGTITFEIPPPSPASPTVITTLDTPYLIGGRLLWDSPLEGLRLGGSVQYLELKTRFFLGTTPAAVDLPALLWIGSVEYTAGGLRLAGEYSRWHVDTESSDEALFPSSSATSERAYVMGSVRLTPWLEPGVYYSLVFPDVDDRSGPEASQHDIAATLRFDVGANWLIKLEGHYMIGTAALSSSLNRGVPLAELEEHWGLVLTKVTGYF